MSMKFLDTIRDLVHKGAGWVALLLDKLSGGRITPNMITFVGLLAHLPIALMIANGQYDKAAVLLIVFGLFDTLDGQLARLKGKESTRGMLLDASTDRMKEVMLYAGIAYNFVYTSQPYMAVWAVIALGGSLLVSYVKARGEAAVATTKISAAEVNRLFADGLMRFEVRMAALVAGLFAEQFLNSVVIVIAVSAWVTAFGRLIRISRKL